MNYTVYSYRSRVLIAMLIANVFTHAISMCSFMTMTNGRIGTSGRIMTIIVSVSPAIVSHIIFIALREALTLATTSTTTLSITILLIRLIVGIL